MLLRVTLFRRCSDAHVIIPVPADFLSLLPLQYKLFSSLVAHTSLQIFAHSVYVCVCVWGVKRQFLLRPFLSCRFLYTPVKLQVLLLKLLLINYLVNVFSTYHLQQEDMIFFNQLNYRHISTLRCQHTHTKTRLPAVHPLRITSLHNTVSFFSQLIKPEEN